MIAFTQVPSNTRVPGFYPEVDPSLAGFFQENQVALIIAQKLATGTVAAGVPTLIAGDGSEGMALFGQGSFMAEMIKAFRANNLTNSLWAIALDDNGAGVVATLDATITGPATAAGTLNFYVGDVRVQAAVASADTATVVGDSLVAAITANLDLPVTATNLAGVVTVTCRHKGELGNDIRLQMNVLGANGGEATPAGIAVAIPGDGSLASGVTNPSLAAAISAMADAEYDYIVQPFNDAASRDLMDAELDRRWNAINQIYGTAYGARTGSLSTLAAAGVLRNNPYTTTCGLFDGASPSYLRAARWGALQARALSNHPARPLHTLKLIGEIAPPVASRFTFSDKQTLLFSGIATLDPDSAGAVRIGRAISEYQLNSVGSPDTAFLDINTAATLTRIIRELRFVVEAAFIVRRCVLVKDSTPIGPGIPFATPSKIEATLNAHYDTLMRQGLVEPVPDGVKLFEVVIATDPTRVDIVYRPDLANPLMVVAAKVQFSLQWPADLTEAI